MNKVEFSGKPAVSGSRQETEMETQIVKASLDMYIMIVRAALALTEWTVMMLIRRIFISLGSVE